jgi:2-methylisocitrate lyase-like PEP mutase family enzyme
VIPTEEMVQKLRAAADARSDEEFVLIARTDARAVEGFEAAVERSYAYLDAGADVLFFEAPTSEAELRRVGEEFEDVPLVANMTEGGETPLFSAAEFDAMGFDVVLYPATGFKAAARAMRDVYEEIAETGTQEGVMDELVTWRGRNEITGLEEIVELEGEYSTE